MIHDTLVTFKASHPGNESSKKRALDPQQDHLHRRKLLQMSAAATPSPGEKENQKDRLLGSQFRLQWPVSDQ